MLTQASWQEQESCAYIEKPAIPWRANGHANSRKSISVQYQNYGELLMALTVLDKIRYEEIAPGRWQREFRLVFPKTMNLTPTQKKNKHKARAQELFPGLKITHSISDALLLAEYCRRKWGVLKG